MGLEEFEDTKGVIRIWYVIHNEMVFPRGTLYDQVCQWLATGLLFSPGTMVSSNNKIDCHDITEILLKVTITITNPEVNVNLLQQDIHDFDFGSV